MGNKESNPADNLLEDIVRNAVPMDKVWATNNNNHQPLLDEIVGNSSAIVTAVDEILANAKEIPFLPQEYQGNTDKLIYTRPTEQELGIYPSEPVSLPPLKLVEYKNLFNGKTTNLENYLLAGGDINAKNSDGQTPIEVAVSVGSPRDVRIILDTPGFDPRGVDISEPARLQKHYGDVQDYRELEPLLAKFDGMKVAIEADPAQIKARGDIIPADFDPSASVTDIDAIHKQVGSAGLRFNQDSISALMSSYYPAAAVKVPSPDEPSL
ncbi:hypothetical protein [Pseudomonas serbica]|uniref:hypothetical protein n=1 Tax=Pseudomonas serbica TaxID=2965074 RepID=UPI00237BFF5A|nr:hypothetical protein [Pseudomonas serbica]